jgi:hypothetical protein
MILDVLKGWTIPLIAGGVALLVWPLSIAEVIDTGPALIIAAVAAMIGVLHSGLCDFVDERTTKATIATLVAFSALWIFVVLTPVEAKLNPGPELFAAQLPLHGKPVTVPLGGVPGRYRVDVEGNLGSSVEHANAEAAYQVAVTNPGTPDQATLDGKFIERWTQRRSGRRGVSTVHVSHTEQEHSISSATGADLQLALQSLTPGAHDAVGVHVYRDTFPVWLFRGLGVALTVAAMVVDSWRYTDPEELLLTTITLGALLSVIFFRIFGPPHPGFGDLAFNGAIGSIAGLIAGRILVRVVKIARRWRG